MVHLTGSIRPFYVLLAAAVNFYVLVRQVARFLTIQCMAVRSTYRWPFSGSLLSARLITPLLWPSEDTDCAECGCSGDPTGQCASTTPSSKHQSRALTHGPVPRFQKTQSLGKMRFRVNYSSEIRYTQGICLFYCTNCRAGLQALRCHTRRIRAHGKQLVASAD